MLISDYVHKGWSIISKQRRKQFVYILFLMILVSLFEIFIFKFVLEFFEIISLGDSKLFSDFITWRIYKNLNLNSVGFGFFSLLVSGIAIIVGTSLKIICQYISAIYTASIGIDLNNKVLDSTIMMPYEKQINLDTSECLAVFTSKANFFVISFYNLLELILNLFLSIFILLAILSSNFKLSLLLLFSLGSFYSLIVIKAKSNIYSMSKLISKSITKRIDIVKDTLNNFININLEKNHLFIKKNFDLIAKDIYLTRASAEVLKAIPKPLIENITILFLCVIGYIISIQNNIQSQNTLPTLAIFVFGFQRFLPYVQKIYRSYVSTQINKESTKSLINLVLLYKKDNYYSSERKIISNARVANDWTLYLKNIYFKYQSESDYVLKDVSLSISNGDKIGIIGKSGEGKSTLLELILCLLIPSKGEISLDNKIISNNGDQRKLNAWQSSIAYVPQKIYLVNRTIYELINPSSYMRGKKRTKKSEDLVWMCLELVNLHEYIKKLPKKLDTLVGEDGSIFSGGQKQRIALAKAIYSNPKVLILDEATSALDQDNEKIILSNLAEFKKNITILVVSHNPEPFSICNKFIKVENSKVVEVPPREFKKFT